MALKPTSLAHLLFLTSLLAFIILIFLIIILVVILNIINHHPHHCGQDCKDAPIPVPSSPDPLLSLTPTTSTELIR